MDTTLLVIGAMVAGFVALATVLVHQRLGYRSHVVHGRLFPEANVADEQSVLHRRDRRSPLLYLLPVSVRLRERLGRDLERAGWPIRVSEYLALRLFSALAAAAIAVVFFASLDLGPTAVRLVAGLLAGVGGWLVPAQYLARRRGIRLNKIEAQLADSLTAMAKSLRAGSGILQALAFAADETPAPLGEELQAALRDLQLGSEAEDAFTALTERVGSPDLNIAATAIIIQRTVGGNLSEILSNVAATIRERAQVKAEVRVLTSRQRLTGNLVALLPVLVALAFIALNPDIGSLLLTTAPGQIALAIGVAFELLGLWLIGRLAMIEV